MYVILHKRDILPETFKRPLEGTSPDLEVWFGQTKRNQHAFHKSLIYLPTPSYPPPFLPELYRSIYHLLDDTGAGTAR